MRKVGNLLWTVTGAKIDYNVHYTAKRIVYSSTHGIYGIPISYNMDETILLHAAIWRIIHD